MDRKDEWAAFAEETVPVQSVTMIPLDVLVPWTDADGKPQPFKPYGKKALDELTENIRQHGVLSSIRVRPLDDGTYQIIAGHNRVAAAKLAGLVTIPAIVKPMTDEEAAIAMADSNLHQREKILPSERAFAYKVKYDALKHQGTSSQLGTKLRTDELLAQNSSDSRNQIQRYIRLTYLMEELLDMVDAGKIGLTPAVELSYIAPDKQELIWNVLVATKRRVSKGIACQLRAEGEALTESRIYEIMGVDEAAPAEKKKKAVTYKLDVTGLDEQALNVLKTDPNLQDWLLDQLNVYLANHQMEE